MNVGNWTILMVISNNCFKYAPKWMVFKFDFSKIFWRWAHRAPFPRPLPRFFLWLCHQFLGALRPRLGASCSRVNMSIQVLISTPKFAVECSRVNMSIQVAYMSIQVAVACSSVNMSIQVLIQLLISKLFTQIWEILIAPEASFHCLKCAKIVSGWGSAPDPRWGSLQRPQTP